MASLTLIPTSWFSLSHDDRHYPAEKSKQSGTDWGKTIEHDIEPPSVVQVARCGTYYLATLVEVGSDMLSYFRGGTLNTAMPCAFGP